MIARAALRAALIRRQALVLPAAVLCGLLGYLVMAVGFLR
jgi:hypothetical protein